MRTRFATKVTWTDCIQVSESLLLKKRSFRRKIFQNTDQERMANVTDLETTKQSSLKRQKNAELQMSFEKWRQHFLWEALKRAECEFTVTFVAQAGRNNCNHGNRNHYAKRCCTNTVCVCTYSNKHTLTFAQSHKIRWLTHTITAYFVNSVAFFLRFSYPITHHSPSVLIRLLGKKQEN